MEKGIYYILNKWRLLYDAHCAIDCSYLFAVQLDSVTSRANHDLFESVLCIT